LSKGHKDLTDRLDVYEKSMDDNTKITKGIDRKVDDLIEKTAAAVAYAQRVSLTSRAFSWLVHFSQKMLVQVGQIGVGILFLLTLYFVFRNSGDWGKAFINIFNGNLS
jgi:hypothetical protein